MRTRNRFLTMSAIILACALVTSKAFFQSKNINLAEASANSEQDRNYQGDLTNASNYWEHNNLAFDYARSGQYEKSVAEYQAAIEVIEKMPGDKWPNLKQEDADRINQHTRIQAQIFSRYGLAEALEKVGRFEEALQNVDWLIQNQHVKGKEELLKQKLDGMRQSILQKMHQRPTQEAA